MKTEEQIHAHQSSLPPLRSYFIVWERPHGSYTWTQLGGMFTEADKANEFARKRVDHKERPICDCVVSEVKLARMPAPKGSEPVALLVKGLYYGIGHARIDDDHHAMMNGPRIAQALGLCVPAVLPDGVGKADVVKKLNEDAIDHFCDAVLAKLKALGVPETDNCDGDGDVSTIFAGWIHARILEAKRE